MMLNEIRLAIYLESITERGEHTRVEVKRD
jgi:hypothetical protein